MRVLLDSCVPRKLGREITEHVVETAPQLGCGDLDDGELLDAMGGRFDALVTVDKNLRFQQNLQGRRFGLIVLRAKTNRLTNLKPLVPKLRSALANLTPGDVIELFDSGEES
jgi:predicted nuclease of predicted toxin-antitoxin system